MDYNKRVVIFGAGIVARGAIIALKADERFDNNNLIGCAVTNPSVNVSWLEGIRVRSIREYKGMKDLRILISVTDKYVDEVILLLEEMGFSDYGLLSIHNCVTLMESTWKKRNNKEIGVFIEKKQELEDLQYLLFLSKQLKGDVLSFEVNLANHCNLNCQCCNHFSPIAKKEFLDIKQYKNDILRLRELFGEEGIGRVMLLGGEPLLNRNIIEVMRLTREIMDKAVIYIITNGVLLPKMENDFWESCRELNIHIKFTRYPINFDYDYWVDYANKRGITMVDETGEKVKSTYRLPFCERGGLDPIKNYMKCYHANQCIVLRDGRLYTCPMSAWITILNEKYKKTFPELKKNSIDIYNVRDKQEIMDYLRKPVELCKYCEIDNYQYEIPWGTSKREIGEWINI